MKKSSRDKYIVPTDELNIEESKKRTSKGSSVFGIVGNHIEHVMTRIGANTYYILKHFVKSLHKKIKTIVKTNALRLKKLFVLIFKKFKDMIKRGLRSVGLKIVNACWDVVNNVRTAKQEGGFFHILKAFVKAVCSLIYRGRGILVTIFNYAIPVVSIVFLIGVIKSVSAVEYGIMVEQDGKLLGYISDESVYDQAEKLFQDRITYTEGNSIISIKPTFTLQQMSAGTKYIDENTLADNMLSNSAADLEYAWGFYINDKFLGAIDQVEKEMVEKELNKLLDAYRKGMPGEKVSFVDNIDYKYGLYFENARTSAEQILELVTSKSAKERYYVVKSGDAPLSIARNFGLSLDELVSMNPGILEKLYPGDKIVVSKEQPYLSVKTTYTTTYEQVIKYEIVYVKDATKYQGTETLLTSGSDGSANITAEIVLINGYESERNVIKTVILEEAKPRKISVGTKVLPGNIGPSGGWLWPISSSSSWVSAPYGYTAYYGSFHRGLDIAAAKNTPIYSVAQGRVIYAGTRGDFGKCVMIDHGGGVVTLYAHMNKILVTNGQYVQKGDNIGLVGSTGLSTGYHLHVEFRIDGQRVNPEKYIKRP